MSDDEPLDRQHLLDHACALFPGTTIAVIYTPDEIIHIDVDGHRFTFEIGSDDDEYICSIGRRIRITRKLPLSTAFSYHYPLNWRVNLLHDKPLGGRNGYI